MEEIVIQEKCVPVEIAKLLKGIGFDEKISMFYMYNPPWIAKGGVQKGNSYTGPYGGYANLSNSDWEKRIHEIAKTLRFDGNHPPISAPSYDMVIDWILDKFGYFVNIVMVGKNEFCFEIVTYSFDLGLRNINGRSYSDRYSAMDAAFKMLLNTIKNRKKSKFTKELLEMLRKEKT